jgi:hypothetical protein
MAGSARAMAAVGIAIGLGAAGTLLWNEWRLARSSGALAEVRQSLEQGDGRAIRVSGEARAAAPARDPLFEVAVPALRLDRTAETFQWREQREGSGDNKVLRYERVWSPALIASRRFEQRSTHANPAALRIETARFAGGGTRLGGLVLDAALVDRLPATRELFPERDRRPLTAAGLIFARAGDWLYSGEAAAPAIGDVRVRFAAAPEGLATAIGTEADGRLEPFRSGSGEEVGLAAYGDVTAETLLGDAARGDWREAWALRGFAGLVMLMAALFVTPSLERRGLGTAVLLAGGAWAAACGLGWLGARLLVAAVGAGGAS